MHLSSARSCLRDSHDESNYERRPAFSRPPYETPSKRSEFTSLGYLLTSLFRHIVAVVGIRLAQKNGTHSMSRQLACRLDDKAIMADDSQGLMVRYKFMECA